MMNAAVYREFGGPIRVERVPLPTLTDSESILLKVQATGVCRSDWHGWKGHDGDVRAHGLPFVPGHEVSGEVVEIGNDVELLNVGDRVVVPFILSCGHCVYCEEDNKPTVCEDQKQPGFTQWGSFAEYVCIPRADRNVRRLPNNVSYTEAAALGCRFTTAYRAIVQQGQIDANKSLAVFGCGGVGLSSIMIAAAVGCQSIIAVDISQGALRKAKELGATNVVHAKNDETVREQVWKLTGGQGTHVTVDAGGFRSTCEAAISCTRRGGRMVQVGLPIGEDRPVVDMGAVAGRELELVGSHGFAADDLPALLDLVAKGTLQPSKLIERQVSLEEGAKELEAMDRGSPLGISVITRFYGSSRL